MTTGSTPPNPRDVEALLDALGSGVVGRAYPDDAVSPPRVGRVAGPWPAATETDGTAPSVAAVLRAAAGPATSHELGGEQRALMDFHRYAQGQPRVRRSGAHPSNKPLFRLPVGRAAALVAAGLATGGFALAGTQGALPSPIQDAIHAVVPGVAPTSHITPAGSGGPTESTAPGQGGSGPTSGGAGSSGSGSSGGASPAPAHPTGKPTANPSNPDHPTGKPTANPSNPNHPTGKPTAIPSNPNHPTGKPTAIPSNTDHPTGKPTATPSNPDHPTGKPTAIPSNTNHPTGKPTAKKPK